MKLSISNIGWPESSDDWMYERMGRYGYEGLEIAPTRIFPESPYEQLEEAYRWKKELQSRYGLAVSSMQSIWYGRSENLFGSMRERNALTAYTKKAVDFAETVGCGNLVFGCPKNRSIPEHRDPKTVVQFFRELGNYAYAHHTVIAMEANPPIYHTNFLNTTEEAMAFVELVDTEGFRLNADIGTMIANGEDITILQGREFLLNHVHISEPGLRLIQKRKLHLELADLLRRVDYQGFVSIEIGNQPDRDSLMESMKYVKEIFG